MTRGMAIVAGVVILSTCDAWTRSVTAEGPASGAGAGTGTFDAGPLEDALERAQEDLAMLRLQLARADAVIDYSTRYHIPAGLAAQVYSAAISQGIDPGLAFHLVWVESAFDARATSRVGAVGLTQILPSTARLYEPDLSLGDLYDPATNLRLGFHFLHDLLARFGSLGNALVAYNRGPAKVQEMLRAGVEVQTAYSKRVAEGYRR